MKNFLDSKLSEGVKEIIGSTLAKHNLPRHNQRSSHQIFKILRPTHNSKANNQTANIHPKKDDSNKREFFRTDKENSTVAMIKKEITQQSTEKGVEKDDCCFDSFRPQKKLPQEESGLRNSQLKVSVPLTKKNSLNNIGPFEKTPEKKVVQGVRGRSAARTIHSLLPSPQITPNKTQGKRQQREAKDKSYLNSPYQASSKKKIYIGLISSTLTPSRSPLKANK